MVDTEATIRERLASFELSPSSREGTSCAVAEGEEIVKTQDNVVLSDPTEGSSSAGKLSITTQRVIWAPQDNGQSSYSFDLLSVVLHALSHGGEEGKGGIFMQVEVKGEDDAHDQEVNSIDLLFIPEDQTCLNDLFQGLCDCVAMNPDDLSESDLEDGIGADFNEAGILGDPAESDLNELLDNDPGRFADAEENS